MSNITHHFRLSSADLRSEILHNFHVFCKLTEGGRFRPVEAVGVAAGVLGVLRGVPELQL